VKAHSMKESLEVVNSLTISLRFKSVLINKHLHLHLHLACAFSHCANCCFFVHVPKHMQFA